MDRDYGVSALRSGAEVAAAAHAWRELQQATRATIYDGPDWYRAWLNTFGADKQPRVLAVAQGGRLIGIVPLVQSRVWRRPWLSLHHVQPEDLPFLQAPSRRGNLIPLRQLSVPAGLQCGSIRGHWIARPGTEREVVTAVGRHLAACTDWDMLVFPGLLSDLDQLLHDGLRAGGLSVESRPGLTTLYGLHPQPWGTYFKSRSSHFRQRFQSAERTLAKLGALRCVSVTAATELPGALARMFALAARSRKQVPRPGQNWYLPLTPAMVAFYTDLCGRYAGAGGCVFNEVYVDERLAGTLFSIVDNGKAYALQTYFDDDFATGSPGRLLLREIIDWAARHELDWIDFNGNSPVVRMFASVPVPLGQAWVFRRRGYSALIHGTTTAVESLRRIVATCRATPTATPAEPEETK